MQQTETTKIQELETKLETVMNENSFLRSVLNIQNEKLTEAILNNSIHEVNISKLNNLNEIKNAELIEMEGRLTRSLNKQEQLSKQIELLEYEKSYYNMEVNNNIPLNNELEPSEEETKKKKRFKKK